MKKKSIKLGVLLTIFTVFGMNVFAQTTTMKVMKNGVAVFQSEVSEIEKIVFQDPSGSVTVSSNDALVVNKSNGSSADKILLDSIKQLTFLDGNLSVVSVSDSSSVYSFGNITNLTFNKIITGISNPKAQSPEVIVYVNSDGNIKVECTVEIKSLTLFSIDGKTVTTVETGRTSFLQCPSAGIYILAVETTQGTIVKKIVK